MPCFKGIAVSVHAQGAPLSEYSIQKHSKTGRVTTYIPVPQPKVPSTSGKPEKSKFAISITLLTPGLPIPYTKPKPTPDNPDPQPQHVSEERDAKKLGPGEVCSYSALTESHNETIAAYIYFDGRGKEEVATLLRPGEETWVNSRWVTDADGGLAEREFLFREVGLERWLNGLDLDKQEGQAAKLEQRREKLRKRRERQQEKFEQSLKGGPVAPKKWSSAGSGLLVYGSDATSPVVAEFSEADEDSDDDEPPESTGQIKVAMFRVLASGEIKKGEYSPQFDANDDGDAMDAGDDEADHTTSFAKPKALDPNSISTQTVTGLDGPENPYAVFTFLYRGERQLRKMGILSSGKGKEPTSATGKGSSRTMDFSKLPPLKSGGTVGFTNFRDNTEASSGANKARKKSNGSMKVNGDDSDDDEDEDIKIKEEVDMDDKDESMKTLLSPEESEFRGQLAEGLNRIKLKRQRSSDHNLNNTRQSPSLSAVASPNIDSSPSPDSNMSLSAAAPSTLNSAIFSNSGVMSGDVSNSIIGSPMKKHRSSMLGSSSASDVNGNGVSNLMGLPSIDIMGQAERASAASAGFGGNGRGIGAVDAMDDEEEL